MAIPNGISSMLSSAQAGIVQQAGGSLFQAGKPDAATRLANMQIAERKVKAKAKPTTSDLLKLSGASSLGFLLLHNTIKDLGANLGAKGGAKGIEDGFLKNIFGEDSLISNLMNVKGAGGKLKGVASKIAPKATKFLAGSTGKLIMGSAMIAGGVLLAVKDGMAGSKKAKQWGVGKFNAGVSAALTSSSKGAKGALAGAAKYGLIGAGLGTIIPGVGNVIGGAIGIGVGTVLGAIGGERTAKFFQGLGKKTSKLWSKTLLPFGKKLVTGITHGMGFLLGGPLGLGVTLTLKNLAKSGKMKAIWKSDSPLGKKMLMSVGAIATSAWDAIGKPLGAGIGLLKSKLQSVTTNSDGTKNILGKTAELMSAIPGKLLEGLNGLGEFIAGEEQWAELKNYFTDNILGGFTKFFTDIGGWIKGLFGLNDSAKEELDRGNWEKDFKKSAEFAEHEAAIKAWKASGKVGPEPESKKEFLERMWAESQTTVNDGIFNLNKALSAGSLFGPGSNVKFNSRDDLYLMASTNPARDALVGAVEQLNGLIGELANAIQNYKPETKNIQTAIENTAIPMRQLLAKPGVYSI